MSIVKCTLTYPLESFDVGTLSAKSDTKTIEKTQKPKNTIKYTIQILLEI